MPLKDRVTGSKFMDEFEDHKRKFEGTHSEDQEVDMTVSLRMPKADMDDEEVASRCDPDEWTITITRYAWPPCFLAFPDTEQC